VIIRAGEGDTPSGIVVRQAERNDLAGVVACLAAAFEPYRMRYTPEAFQDTVPTAQDAERRLREMTVLVAGSASVRVAGTIAYQVVQAGEGHLRGMAVLPDLQGRGVAERLLARAEADLRALGCSRVTLDTTAPLERAIRFYRRQGYVPSGVVKDFFGMPLFEYAKDLRAATV
jgi:ribosomal protein S18 acetylase RimI-like enzyme